MATLNSGSETRVERRKRNTRERIFRTALQLFVENGLDATTVAQIAAAADIGKGTFFTYYPTKESIFADVSARLVDDMERTLDAVPADATVEARVLAFFEPAIDWHASNPVLSRHMVAAFMRDPAYASTDRINQQRLYDRLAQLLTQAQRAGEIGKDVDVPAALTVIGGTYFGSLGVWHGGGRDAALRALFSGSLRIVFRGLRP